MKTAYFALFAMAPFLVAQGLVAEEFRAPAAPQQEIVDKPNWKPDLSPRPTGIIYMMSEHGLEIINPLSDGDLGRGEAIITRNINPDDRLKRHNDDPKPFGGLMLFGWEF